MKFNKTQNTKVNKMRIELKSSIKSMASKKILTGFLLVFSLLFTIACDPQDLPALPYQAGLLPGREAAGHRAGARHLVEHAPAGAGRRRQQARRGDRRGAVLPRQPEVRAGPCGGGGLQYR